MGHIVVTTRYSNQQGSKSRQNPCQILPTKNIGDLSARVKTMSLGTNYSTVSTVWSGVLPVFHHLNYKLNYREITSYREQSRSTRIVVAYPRSALSAKKRTNHAPISFDQQAQVSRTHTSCRSMQYYTMDTEVHGSGGLEPVKLAREPTSSRPKPSLSLKNAPRILPVRRSLLALVGRKQTVVRDQVFP